MTGSTRAAFFKRLEASMESHKEKLQQAYLHLNSTAMYHHYMTAVREAAEHYRSPKKPTPDYIAAAQSNKKDLLKQRRKLPTPLPSLITRSPFTKSTHATTNGRSTYYEHGWTLPNSPEATDNFTNGEGHLKTPLTNTQSSTYTNPKENGTTETYGPMHSNSAEPPKHPKEDGEEHQKHPNLVWMMLNKEWKKQRRMEEWQL